MTDRVAQVMCEDCVEAEHHGVCACGDYIEPGDLMHRAEGVWMCDWCAGHALMHRLDNCDSEDKP